MKKIFSSITIIIIAVLLLGCGEKIQKVDNPSDQLSSSEKNEKELIKEDIENFLVRNIEEIHEKNPIARIEHITLNLSEMETIYNVDISKYKADEYNCDLIDTFVTINYEENKENTYTLNISCKAIR